MASKTRARWWAGARPARAGGRSRGTRSTVFGGRSRFSSLITKPTTTSSRSGSVRAGTGRGTASTASGASSIRSTTARRSSRQSVQTAGCGRSGKMIAPSGSDGRQAGTCLVIASRTPSRPSPATSVHASGLGARGATRRRDRPPARPPSPGPAVAPGRLPPLDPDRVGAAVAHEIRAEAAGEEEGAGTRAAIALVIAPAAVQTVFAGAEHGKSSPAPPFNRSAPHSPNSASSAESSPR